jgi:hypothetical protein
VGPRTGLIAKNRKFSAPVVLSARTALVTLLYDVVSAGEGHSVRSCAGQESEEGTED